MSKEIKINKMNRSITFINNNIGFSQMGVAPEILDLIENQEQEVERLNNIINELEEYLEWSIGQDMYRLDFKIILDKLQELKGSDKSGN